MFTILNKLSVWCFPHTCVLCQHSADRSQDLCQFCYTTLPILTQTCSLCAKTFEENSIFCSACTRILPSFDAAYALFTYQPPITKWIMELKFHGGLNYARLLGELMASAVTQNWYLTKPLPERILPVPLHPRRLRERGFNQALEIAKPIARATGIPLDLVSCVRIKHTEAQARLEGKKRFLNTKNAFKIQEDIHGLHIAVLGDVITTGQTLANLCLLLKQYGAAKVDVWCCAKTL